MGWKKKVAGHECAMPKTKFEKHAVGSVWECECGLSWRIVRWYRTWAGDSPEWELVR